MAMTRQYHFTCDHPSCRSDITVSINPRYMNDGDWLVAERSLPHHGWKLAVDRLNPQKQLHFCPLHGGNHAR